jgi:hypothetical protein
LKARLPDSNRQGRASIRTNPRFHRDLVAQAGVRREHPPVEVLIAGEIEMCVQLWRPQRFGWECSPVLRMAATALIDRVRTEGPPAPAGAREVLP